MTSFKMDGKAILIVTIGALIAVAFIATIADSIFEQTNTINVVNTSVTAPAVNASIDLLGREFISGGNVGNASDNTIIGAIIETGTSATTGLRTVRLRINDTAAGTAGLTVNVSYVANPDGYLSDLSSRAVASLILIFGALAILIFVIVVFMKEGSLGKLMEKK